MDIRDYRHRLADMYERGYEIEQELKKVHLKTIMEDEPTRKQWFMDAQDRLNMEKQELDQRIQRFIDENGNMDS